MSILAALQARNTRTVTLVQDGDTARHAPPGTPGALAFTLARVPAREIRQNLLYAALGRDGYLAYANWYHAQAQQALASAEAATAKPDAAPPFDDSLPEDAQWRAHTLALEEAVERELLQAGLLLPEAEPFAAVYPVLGPMRGVLVRELIEWGRETPEDPNSPSGNSEPP